MRLLLAEDQPRLSALVKRSLDEDGYSTDVVANGIDAETAFEVNDYDLVILDIMMPGKSGIEVCRTIRAQNVNVPIIMLTALDGVEDRVNGLDSGADDYLVKPFSVVELTARIRALLRRGASSMPSIITIGDLTLNPATKVITYKDQILNLTAKEYSLLSYLMYHSSELISKTDLLEHVWDMNYDGLSNVVETYVRYVRKKLRENGAPDGIIVTVRNLGYKLAA